MKLFGYISFSIVLATMFVFIGLKIGDGYVFNFINNDSIGIAITLLGFNIAIHTILVGQITDIEIHHNKLGHLSGTRKELKENAIANIYLLVFMFILRLMKIGGLNSTIMVLGLENISRINFFIEILILSCIIMIVSLMYETITAVYKIYETKGSLKS